MSSFQKKTISDRCEKRYELRVFGRMENVPGETEKLYRCVSRPQSKDHIYRIAEDFISIRRFQVQEITMAIRTELISY